MVIEAQREHGSGRREHRPDALRKTYLVLGAVVVAATLESVFALCIGCKLFAVLMRAGVIPEEVCERCSDIRVDPAPATDRR